MKVYLLKTPEYSIEHFEDVLELLSSFEGPLDFVTGKYEFNPEQFPFLGKFSDDIDPPALASNAQKLLDEENNGRPLTWEELFKLCDFYRQTFSIDNSDFVTLLTNRRNALNFFSIFTETRNAFVQTSEWELFTHVDSKFPITYEVVATILRCLMKLPLQLPNKWVHEDPIGCINDFCDSKKEIILKLRTADICHDCLSKMRDEKVDDEIINQAIGIFEAVRNQLLFKQGFTKNLNPKPVTIDTRGTVTIGNKTIDLNPLESTLFIFFLNLEQGMSLNDLQSHKEKLLNIYRKIRPAGEESSIDELIKPYYQGGTFSVNKSRLNKKLKKEIGEPLANFYYLEGNRGEAFKINISPDFVSSDIRY